MKKLILLALIFFPSISYGAITRDVVLACAQTAGTTVTRAITIAEANEMLIVFAYNSTGATKVQSVKYNGVSLATSTVWTASVPKESFYLYNPSTGANNLVITLSSAYIDACAVAYKGGGSTFPSSKTEVANPTGKYFHATTTTTVDNSILVGYQEGDASGTAYNATNLSLDTGRELRIFESNPLLKSPAGSYTMGYTYGSDHGGWSTIMLSYAPASAAPAIPKYSDVILFE